VRLLTRRDETMSCSKYKLLAEGFHNRIVFLHAEHLNFKLIKMSILSVL